MTSWRDGLSAGDIEEVEELQETVNMVLASVPPEQSMGFRFLATELVALEVKYRRLVAVVQAQAQPPQDPYQRY